jgi:iron-sulfur cluster assembly protein
MSIDVTEAAQAAIRIQLWKRRKVGFGNEHGALRVGLKGGGCSGFTYVLQFEDGPPGARDTILSFDLAGDIPVKIYIDPKSAVLLRDATLDYEQTLLKSGFKFHNPQEKSSCGCGESFSV